MSEFEQKVLKLLEDINGKLDKLLKSEIASPTSVPSTPTPSAAPTPAATTVKPSEIVDKQEMEEKLMEKPPIEGRRVCPECGGTSFNTVEDKTQVLHQMGGVKIYAKKYICRQCGAEM
ncbi:MAG: hypothetical protein ACFFDN_47230 [Candidatus Hodarchaeota archaeon]